MIRPRRNPGTFLLREVTPAWELPRQGNYRDRVVLRIPTSPTETSFPWWVASRAGARPTRSFYPPGYADHQIPSGRQPAQPCGSPGRGRDQKPAWLHPWVRPSRSNCPLPSVSANQHGRVACPEACMSRSPFVRSRPVEHDHGGDHVHVHVHDHDHEGAITITRGRSRSRSRSRGGDHDHVLGAITITRGTITITITKGRSRSRFGGNHDHEGLERPFLVSWVPKRKNGGVGAWGRNPLTTAGP